MNEQNTSEPVGEKLLYTEKVLGQYKLFYIDYKENKRGRFLKITEKDGRFRSTIIIPEEALQEFVAVANKVLDEHQAYLDSLPADPDSDEFNIAPESHSGSSADANDSSLDASGSDKPDWT